MVNFPPQQLPFSKKNKAWRKQIVDWANTKTFFNFSPVRKSVIHKKINYDLLNGIIHMSDLQLIVNPGNIKANFIPDRIQHFPIMNSKLNVLIGEEMTRIFDFKVVVTNPNAVSEKEDKRKKELINSLQNIIQNQDLSDDDFQQKQKEIQDYYKNSWQDDNEILANCLLNHYSKEYNMPLLFNNGFRDALTVGEEIYQCDIVGGEPVVSRINPMKIRIFKSGFSNKVEDADIIILEDYWSPGRVIDTYYDVLTKKDIEYIESMPDHVGAGMTDSMDNIDERFAFVNANAIDDRMSSNGFFWSGSDLFSDSITNSLLPYDLAGNLRVLRIYWKSKRRIKKVKSYDPETGDEVFNFYPENYILDKSRGEEQEIFYINEAWEGTKIGADIYLNMRPRVIQYNRLSNPSRCHFGIIGSIYNTNDNKPFSLVDMMKPFNYSYDVYYDRLNKLLARNWGQIVRLDLAKAPRGWDVEKVMYYAKTMGLLIEDSFKEGNHGAATGKLAGSLNNNSTGVINAELGQSIQQTINILEYIKSEMGEIVGISRQREGQISNRETVGGVERATLQSAHITECLFGIHDDVKRRVYECFLETAKICLKGHNEKFSYILSDESQQIAALDKTNFADNDYGLVVDSSNSTQILNQKLDTLAQAALQNSKISFSSIMKLYSSCSIAEKMKIIENDEKNIQDQQQQQQQQELQTQKEIAQQQQQQLQAESQMKEQQNIRDNQTKLLIAQMNSQAQMQYNNNNSDEIQNKALDEKARQFNEKLDLEKQKLEVEKKKTSQTKNSK